MAGIGEAMKDRAGNCRGRGSRALMSASGAVLLALLLALAPLTRAADINAMASTIVVTFRQESVPVDAAFKRFSGHIDFDPAHPAEGHATLQVVTASLDLGSPAYAAELERAEWFNSALYPSATFVSTAFSAAGAGHLIVTGTFTLKGRAQMLTVPVTVTRSGTATVFDGSLQLSRKYFSIGSADWNGVLDDIVRVRFHLVQ